MQKLFQRHLRAVVEKLY